MKFEDMNIAKEITSALKEMGIEEPTKIQELSIPLLMKGRNVIGKSKTGSGKTLSFGVPVLEKVVAGGELQALIVAPTRELACQIRDEMQKFGKNLNLKISAVYGGVAIDPQIQALAVSEVIVGTPGRLVDHLRRKTLILSKLKILVLDEADKMMEMGFIEDIENIIRNSCSERQIALFGATISREINRLKGRYMANAKMVLAEERVEEEFLEQYYYNIKPFEKFSLLVHLLKTEKINQAIVFCSARKTVDIVARNLLKNGFRVEFIHGNLSQNKRHRALDNFNASKADILVASAVAARGLDIKAVSHVFNYDLSRDAQEYVHRIGRTARAGERGKAITLLSEKDHDVFRNILSYYRMNVRKLEIGRFPRIRFDVIRGNVINTGRSRWNRRRFPFSKSRINNYTGRNPGRNFGRKRRSFESKRA